MGGVYNGTNNGITYSEGMFGLGGNKIQHDNHFIVSGLPQMDEFSVTMWVNFENVSPNNFPGIIAPVNAGNESLRSSHFGNGKFLVNVGSSDVDTGISSVNLENEWHMITFVNHSGGFDFYVDDGSSQFSSPSVKVWDTTSLMVGKQSSNNEGFIGIMDEIRIFNKKLNVTEVSKVYNVTNTFKSTRMFSDVSVSGRDITTRVNMSATGNRMTKLDFDIYKDA